MKFTAIFLLAAAMQVSAKGYSQQVTLDFRNAELTDVFKSIRQQTGYLFVYDLDMIKQAKKVNLHLTNATVEEALSVCFKDQPLSYTIVEKTIVIKEKSPNEPTTTEPPPPIDVSGRVTDENNNPLVGATVTVKGNKITVKTDDNGVFVLKGIDENATLEISFVGYQTLTILVNKRTSIITSLKVEVQKLNEVIINKGYYTEKQKYSVGNATHIGSDVIEKQPVQNPLLALQGRVPGLEVTQLTGLPGGGVTARIQGRNSINSGLDPLIVIDGVPYPSQFIGNDPSIGLESIVQGGSPLNYINPNDIESIDVLKDADATAIYGSKAANGAILITTKKGKIGKTKLTINGQQGWSKINHEVGMLNTRQYLDMRYEAFRNDGKVFSTQTPNSSNYDLKLWDTTRYTNWQKTLIGGTARYTNINASLSGGNAAVQYLVGGSYNRQTTVFPGDFDDKVGGLHFNINGASPNQRLKLQLTGSYTYDQNHLPGVDLTSEAILIEPDAPALYKADGTLNWATDAAGKSSWTNPLAFTQNSDFNNTSKNLVTNVQLNYNILTGLNFLTSLGYSNTQSEIYSPTRLNFYAPEVRATSQRSASFGNRNMSSWIIEPQLTYSHTLGKGRLEGLLATSIQKSSYNYLSITGSGFLTDVLMKTLLAATSINVRNSLSGLTRFNALFSRLSYNWDDKYIVNLTARRDGSNRFGANNRFHNFGSIGLGWIFSKGKWVSEQLPFLSFGKLRSSYGITGNDGIPDFSYLSIYTINNPTILYQNSIGLTAYNIPNPELQWEETRKLQCGIDLGFAKDRFIIGVTYARNRSSNQLVQYILPTITGFGSINKNFPALIQNTSWELTLNTLNFSGVNIKWASSLNVTIPQNKLISYPGLENSSLSSVLTIGKPLGMIKAAQYAGINPANGNYLILDRNGNPIVSSPTIADQTILISTLSRYYGGISNTISYKGIQLDFFIQFVKRIGTRDMYFYNGVRTPGGFVSGSSNQPVSVLNRWQKPGDNALIPYFTTSNFSKSISASDAWYSYDASYVRLKNVSLSWQLPAVWVQKVNIQAVRLYLHAENLITITKYTGLDPETMSSSTLPPLRMMTLGGQIEF